MTLGALAERARRDPSELDAIDTRGRRAIRIGIGTAAASPVLAAVYFALGARLPFLVEILLVTWAPLALVFGMVMIGLGALQVARVARARRALDAERLPVAQLRR
jgi:hypothetical protein